MLLCDTWVHPTLPQASVGNLTESVRRPSPGAVPAERSDTGAFRFVQSGDKHRTLSEGNRTLMLATRCIGMMSVASRHPLRDSRLRTHAAGGTKKTTLLINLIWVVLINLLHPSFYGSLATPGGILGTDELTRQSHCILCHCPEDGQRTAVPSTIKLSVRRLKRRRMG